MNPRNRRLVIPVALGGLIVLVVLRRWSVDHMRLASERAPAPRAVPDARPHPRRRRARPRGRVRTPARPGDAWKRVELRYVDLKAGRHLQITAYDDTQAHTANHAAGYDGARRRRRPARPAVRELARRDHHPAAPGAGHQEARGDRAHHRPGGRGRGRPRPRPAKARLLPEDDPVLMALGLSDERGRIKPSRQAKYRQVEEFLRLLDAAITDALTRGHLRTPTVEDPLRIVDLGCGNAYLTFTAERFLTHVRGLPVRLTGVDVKEQSRDHNSALAAELGVDAEFVVGSIAGAEPPTPPEVVLALHACDTATDEALARAVEWEAPLVLAAPVLPPRHRRTAAPQPDARAVLPAHPARHPPRAVRRHPHRRAAGLAAAAAGLPRRRGRVRREPAHAAQHAAARGTHRQHRSRAAASARSTTTWSRTWAVRPKLAELLERLACVRSFAVVIFVPLLGRRCPRARGRRPGRRGSVRRTRRSSSPAA